MLIIIFADRQQRNVFQGFVVFGDEKVVFDINIISQSQKGVVVLPGIRMVREIRTVGRFNYFVLIKDFNFDSFEPSVPFCPEDEVGCGDDQIVGDKRSHPVVGRFYLSTNDVSALNLQDAVIREIIIFCFGIRIGSTLRNIDPFVF